MHESMRYNTGSFVIDVREDLPEDTIRSI